ncbi:cytochrome P450 [Streptomyces sp. SL13]|uniref:Cytochrome P450 n=1 Tax=Streptantibioticus silvisoli TaxID=2705255 RepID=A0AA90H0D6_9ACTN|nr:cytochrome P450 [Streptantibioticus silvisoli]MDI5961155.1 cytochrome P450 [Streptantibioticus silvisoli]MDI5970959.1 cytochrome P450 [Streptantibioticus silvisoli]
MSISPTDPSAGPSGAAPPPGCPAHGLDAEGISRLYGPDAEADPMALYNQLREKYGEVAPVLVPGDVQAWLVLSHAGNLRVLNNPLQFSSDPRNFNQVIGPEHPLAPITFRQSLINFADGEEHKRLRAAVTDVLAKVNTRGVRQRITQAVNDLVAEFAPEGRADLVKDVAEHLPMIVMSRLVGIDDVPAQRLAEACRDLMQGTPTAVDSNKFLLETLYQLVETKKTAPGRDLASWLLEHEAGLEDKEVVEHLRHILVASNETTVNLISDALRVALTHTAFRAHLAGGSMTVPDALDDVLWNNPPLRVLPARYAVGDITLGEQEIRGGDMVLNGIAAGNVDPLIRPDLSSRMSGNRSHLAFSSGPHECPGQSLGKTIAEVAIDVVLAGLPDLQIDLSEGELTRTPTWTSSHLDTLPVVFTPVKVQRRPTGAMPLAGAAMPAEQPATAAVFPPAEQPAPVAGTPRPSWWRRLLRLR